MDHRSAAAGRGFEAARLQIARLKRVESGGLQRLIARALEICSRALNVGRVGVWMIDESIPGLRCAHLHDTIDPTAAPGEELHERDLGEYVRIIAERCHLASPDVRADPDVVELSARYFASHDIVATLDVPYYRDGEVIGVICHEHRGEERTWTSSEIGFAQCVAEIVSHALTNAQLIEALEALRALERERQEALRTESLTRVVRGIAHDLGSTLQAILLQAELLSVEAHDADSVRAAAEGIIDLGGLARAILKGMSDYTVGDKESPSPVVIDVALERAHSTLRALAGAEREVSLSLDAPGVVVRVSPTGLERALANLVVNAREATVSGGLIAVASRLDGDEVRVEVRDDGMGMDEETSARIFEPYFTTHEGGARRGLGLSIVAAVVRAAGGSVAVESAPGEGACMILRLPRDASV